MSVESAAAIVAGAMQKEKTVKAKAKAAAKCALKRPAAAWPEGSNTSEAKAAKVKVEESRSQAVAHFGTGPGCSKVFKWGKGRSKNEAINAAQGWLNERMG